MLSYDPQFVSLVHQERMEALRLARTRPAGRAEEGLDRLLVRIGLRLAPDAPLPRRPQAHRPNRLALSYDLRREPR